MIFLYFFKYMLVLGIVILLIILISSTVGFYVIGKQVQGQTQVQEQVQAQDQVQGQIPEQIQGQIPEQIQGQIPEQIQGQTPEQIQEQIRQDILLKQKQRLQLDISKNVEQSNQTKLDAYNSQVEAILTTSGWKESCDANCSTNTPNIGYEDYCAARCNETSCKDCIYKGPWIESQKSEQPSGKKEYCSAYCASKAATPGFEEQCALHCIETTCWDCPYKGPYDKAPEPSIITYIQPEAKQPSGKKEYCNAYCASKAATPGFEEQCALHCIESTCWDCPYKGPYDLAIIPVVSKNSTVVTKQPSGKKEYCSAYCASKIATPGFEDQCALQCNEATCWDCPYKGPYDKAIIVQPEIASTWKDYCSTNCGNKITSPGYEDICPQYCTNTRCWDCVYKGPWNVPSGMKDYCGTYCPNKYPGDANVANCNTYCKNTNDTCWDCAYKGPFERTPSGSKDICATNCNSATITPGFDDMCASKCTESSCWDCAYKGPYNKSPSGRSATCGAYCGNKIASPGYEDYCKSNCTETACWDCGYKGPWNVPSGMKDYCGAYCPTKYPGDTNVANCNMYCTNTNNTCWDCAYKGPYARTPSGNSSSCATYCNSATTYPGFENYCPTYCTETACWDCGYKGPYNKPPSGRATTCAAYCSNRDVTPGYEGYCTENCTETPCWDCGYKGPYGKPPSGWKDYCSTYCSTSTPPSYANCPSYCTNANCWDCGYKGPYM